MRIALEEHFVLDAPEHVDRWLTLIPTVPEEITAKIKRPLCDLGEARNAAMAEANIDFAILSNVGTVQGALDAATAMTLARQANDRLAEAVQAHPDHFAGFATVPLQDPEAGAAEFERAVSELGMRGAMIIGQTDGRDLDEDRFSPLWERAQALDVPIYLHAADAAEMPATYAGRPELDYATSTSSRMVDREAGDHRPVLVAHSGIDRVRHASPDGLEHRQLPACLLGGSGGEAEIL